MNHFTGQELKTLSAEIDSQLSELANEPAEDISKAAKRGKKTIPGKQKRQLEQATQEDAESFLKKFARAAKQDLCLDGGMLHEQWKKWGDLDNESMLKNFGGVLAGLGLTAAPLQTAVVAVSVIVVHIGIKAFCEDCE